jgi:TatD DNase family protein
MTAQQPTFYDTHAHLDDRSFTADFPLVLQRARAAGIVKVINVGTDFASSLRVIALSAEHVGLYAVAGWHPSHAHEAPEDLRPVLRELARHPKVVALGETGLDYHWLPTRTDKTATPEDDARHKARQAMLFAQHLEVAVECGLNVVIHQREAFDDTLALLGPWAGRLRAVFHCFGEGPERLQRVLELGFLVSFTGIVTFKNGQNVRASAAAVPAGRFMLETDSPYMAPMPHRGKRCEPAYVREIAETVATVRGLTLAELSRITGETAVAFFPKLESGGESGI